MSLKELQAQTGNRTAMKVKMFVNHAFETVENELNEWLAKEAYKVCHVTQSQSEKQGRFVFVVSVFYEVTK